jgi:hypothetical protein
MSAGPQAKEGAHSKSAINRQGPRAFPGNNKEKKKQTKGSVPSMIPQVVYGDMTQEARLVGAFVTAAGCWPFVVAFQVHLN